MKYPIAVLFFSAFLILMITPVNAGCSNEKDINDLSKDNLNKWIEDSCNAVYSLHQKYNLMGECEKNPYFKTLLGLCDNHYINSNKDFVLTSKGLFYHMKMLFYYPNKYKGSCFDLCKNNARKMLEPLRNPINKMMQMKCPGDNKCRERFLNSVGLEKQQTDTDCYKRSSDMISKMLPNSGKYVNVETTGNYGLALSDAEWKQIETSVNDKGQLVIMHVKGEFSGQHWIIVYLVDGNTVWFYDPNSNNPDGKQIRSMPKSSSFFNHPSIGGDPYNWYEYFSYPFWKEKCP